MLPSLVFSGPVEPYALSESPVCDPTDKPGVLAFRALVLAALGGGDFGIKRECSIGAPSDHWAWSAWDWKLDATNPDDQARARALFEWLLAPDAQGTESAVLRRAGITYLIWNGRVWSTKPGPDGQRGWRDYTGPNPHLDHAHVSFGKAGAAGQTSFYRTLGVTPLAPSPDPIPVASAPTGTPPPSFARPAALAVGAAMGWFGVRGALRIRSPDRRR